MNKKRKDYEEILHVMKKELKKLLVLIFLKGTI